MHHFYNPLILLFHLTAVCTLTLITLRFGKEILMAWISLLAVAMNLFVLKQITFFGFHVTASDALAVGYILGLNLIQEYYGKESARKGIWISFFICFSFLLLAQIQLAYTPNHFDHAHSHFHALLHPSLRLTCASLTTFLIVQFIDLNFFAFLKTKMEKRYLPFRTAASLILSQSLDTVLFSFLGLYGLITPLFHVILFSLTVKIIVIFFSTPFVWLSKLAYRPSEEARSTHP